MDNEDGSFLEMQSPGPRPRPSKLETTFSQHPQETGNRTETKPQFLVIPHLGILSAVLLRLSDEKQVWKKTYWHQNVKKRISTWTHVHYSKCSY